MTNHNELSKISQITNNIYLSGIFPLDENSAVIKKLDIKYILTCVDRNMVSEVHDKIMIENPDVTILYLPYNDDIGQNLWRINQKSVDIVKYTGSIQEYDEIRRLSNLYQNKPMIEIGYHFINHAVMTNKNILVHCMAGISRSVSLIVYYLMKKYNLSFDQAISIVKNKRKIANPNDGFKLQLVGYQNKKDMFTQQDAQIIINFIKFPKNDMKFCG